MRLGLHRQPPSPVSALISCGTLENGAGPRRSRIRRSVSVSRIALGLRHFRRLSPVAIFGISFRGERFGGNSATSIHTALYEGDLLNEPERGALVAPDKRYRTQKYLHRQCARIERSLWMTRGEMQSERREEEGDPSSP